ncbi:MAG: carotenoid oxygenase family protein [Kibdelosporangium sp.]
MPSYLEGLLTPVADEISATDLQVTGTIPAELTGRYFRNGPNPPPGHDPGHWFAGDGMLHGVRLRDGRAEWYRNRWVHTARRDGKQFITDQGIDRTAVTANTSVIRHGGRIFALVEVGFPYEVTAELDTVGPCDFGQRLTTAMTAHPKQDPVTGELHFFGYSPIAPFVTYHRLSSAGELVESREITVPGATMMHDFAVTENHVVWLDLPMVFDLERLGRGLPFGWSDGYGARLGVMPKAGGDVRWFEVDPCYIFHVGNAHEESGRIVLDAVRYDRRQITTIWGKIGGAANPVLETGGTSLHRWTLDPATSTVKEQQLDDLAIEFPTINDHLVGQHSRFLYAVTGDAIVKYSDDRSQVLELGTAPGEAEFVPAENARSEDEGWLLSIVTEHDGSGSDLLILDARSLERVAAVHLPRRVPSGFHGNWLADS